MAHLEFEAAVQQQFPLFKRVAGLDEAGRGALAGPVVAAAVILPLDSPQALASLNQVNDSKKLSAKKRQAFFTLIQDNALAYGIGAISAKIIDKIGIVPATQKAMAQAVFQLQPLPDYLLIDGRITLLCLKIPQRSIVRGDSQSLSIAAASILAKVTRDQLMVALDGQYPAYRFAQHKGYGTQHHRDALRHYGPCPYHRHSFAPLRQK